MINLKQLVINDFVSVIIPCFNAEKWIGEAIESCLNQSYHNLEIIIINDGSNDNSLDIVKKYGDKVMWETGVNRGGNYARNRGLYVSKGEYIQFLDADDYLKPHKIEKQVMFLKETQVDIVYGDVLCQKHLSNGEIDLKPIELLGVPGDHEDYLETALSYGCLPPIAYLIRRSAISRTKGWDETLRSGQNRDFMLTLLIEGASILYQPGFDSVYRKGHSNQTITSNRTFLAYGFISVSKKAESILDKRGILTKKYLSALASSYYIRAYRDRQNISLLCYFTLLYLSLLKYLKLLFNNYYFINK